jgi:hypothetical protein
MWWKLARDYKKRTESVLWQPSMAIPSLLNLINLKGLWGYNIRQISLFLCLKISSRNIGKWRKNENIQQAGAFLIVNLVDKMAGVFLNKNPFD